MNQKGFLALKGSSFLKKLFTLNTFCNQKEFLTEI